MSRRWRAQLDIDRSGLSAAEGGTTSGRRPMNRRTVVLRKIGVILVVAGAAFVLLQAPARHAEAEAAAGVFRLAGQSRIRVADASSIEVLPAAHAPFRAVVTSSCSSIGSLIALACLGSLAPPGRRRTVAVVVAMASVALGNVVRIAASLAIGLEAGRPSLILFHDWVGSIFGFAYTLGGYLLMLHLLLPAPPAPSALRTAPA